MNLTAFIRKLEVGVQQITAETVKVLQEESDAGVTRMRQHFVPYPGGDRPWLSRQVGKLFRRSGEMERSIHHTPVQQSPGRVSVTFAMSGPGVAVQEFGATITAKRAQALTIPGGIMLDSRGVRRFGSVAEARQEFSLFRRGDTLLASSPVHVSRETTKLAYWLRRSVRVPARPVVGPEVRTTAERVAERLSGVVAEAL